MTIIELRPAKCLECGKDIFIDILLSGNSMLSIPEDCHFEETCYECGSTKIVFIDETNVKSD